MTASAAIPHLSSEEISASAPVHRPVAHIRSLSGLRLFAALHVVLYHYWPIFLPGQRDGWLEHNIIGYGFTGVSLFYVLSGYVLSYAYLSADSGRRIQRRRFLLARFARIYPMYAISLLIQAPVLLLYLYSLGFPIRKTGIFFASLGANLGMLQAWAPTLTWNWNQASWSVSVEAVLYISFPFLAGWIWKRVNLRNACIYVPACYISILFIPALLALAGIGVRDSVPRTNLVGYVIENPALRIPEFLLGIITARLHLLFRQTSSPDVYQRVSSWISYVGLAMLCLGWFAARHIPFIVMYNGALDLAFAALIFGLASEAGFLASALSSRLLVFLGEASYSIYILQMPLFAWFALVAHRGTWLSNARPGFHFLENAPLLLLLYVATLLTCSAITYTWIEIPTRRHLMENLSVRKGFAL